MPQVSPGVITKIIDLSEYVQNVPSTIGFLPIISEKGRDNELILTNARDFYTEFGEPNINFGKKLFGQGMYVAANFLKQSDSLYVIRVMPNDDENYTPATYANLFFTYDAVSGYVKLSSETSVNTENEMKTYINFDEDTTSGAVLAITGIGRGAYYNNYQIAITPHSNPVKESEGIYIMDIYKRQLSMNYDEDTSTWEEAFEIVQTFEVSFNPDKLDASGDSLFIADVVNNNFRELYVYADRDGCRDVCELVPAVDWSYAFGGPYGDFTYVDATSDDTTGGDYRDDLNQDGPYRLDNGSDGDIDDSTAMTMFLAQAYAGVLKKVKGLSSTYGDTSQFVDEVLDTEDHYFNIVLDGGYPDDVKTQIVALVKTRADCVCLVDNGDNKCPADALDARLNDHTFNTYFAALYEGYSKIYDVYTGKDIWLTPVYHMAYVVPYTENVAELWYAAAGFNRATLDNIKALRFSPRLGDREQFHLNQINPIVKFNVGYTVWGQLTTQKRPTAMQDLNIVRLVLYIKRALEQYCKYYIFELNDQVTWAAIASNIEKFLRVIKDKRGLYDFSVSVGASAYEIKSKSCHVDVTLDPTRIIQTIFLNFFIV